VTRVLVVDDEEEFRAYMSRMLAFFGLEHSMATDGRAGFESAVREQPQLMFVDWCMQGDTNGLELVRNLRAEARTKHMPIVLMSAKKETDEDELAALLAGADRFFIKRELSLGTDKGTTFKRHLAALILLGAKRASKGEDASAKIQQIGNLRLDPARLEVSVAGHPVCLNRKEFDLLEFFLNHPGAIHSPEKIWRTIWGRPCAGNWEHTLAATLSSLRKNLGFEWSARLVNIKNIGYRLLLN
jgi:DNA-binding response OmpR family regulator